MGKHKNSNDAVGNYCIYEIIVGGKVYKIGKADLDRITKSTNDPTRIHQQIVKLRKKYVSKSVFNSILEELFGVTTSEAKEAEKVILELIIFEIGEIPEGNRKSYPSKKD